MSAAPRRDALWPWLALALLGGCSLLKAQPDRSRFYTLSRVGARAPAPAGPQLVVGVRRVAVPDYLDRPELVTRVGPNEVRLSENDRWAEPLSDGVGRALHLDLSARLGAAAVYRDPWPQNAPIDTVVSVELIRFERLARGPAQLEARFAVRDPKSTAPSVWHTLRLEEPVAGGDSAQTVAALSRALGRLSGQIAEEVRRAGSERQPVAGPQQDQD
jgi:uncharacterized lipoprotein YmbA